MGRLASVWTVRKDPPTFPHSLTPSPPPSSPVGARYLALALATGKACHLRSLCLAHTDVGDAGVLELGRDGRREGGREGGREGERER
jgi:hypothetical protein